MAALGHGMILNLSSFLPYVFQFNPLQVRSEKKISYFEAPNIGGSSRELFFTGFSNKTAAFSLVVLDMEDPTGVVGDISYFDALRSPATDIADIAASFAGNENYPPPEVLFQFGVSLIPLPWKVRNVSITETHFHSGAIGGLLGIPKRAVIDCQFELNEESPFFKANRVAEKAFEIGGSIESITEDGITSVSRARRELPGILVSNNRELDV